ncbi:hypothetical protein HBH70_175310 [Parastagonospora nodorum]|nr:hypothetical protein HBH47_184660 [Parastagonospora nodorum]KAH4614713.1 hypothetical protein HBH82_001230 [Parastagonospora nodorum]KAH4667404.1 hypothetical protein HBH78_196190 [Parastagonospora nodorum]KAH4695113.1 hypothetical protein HBH67_205590 [Parastagonospora nodorum]KAH4762600.1 hypothetical protein HBH63_198080 [Parastagonospora nodorum]
MVTEDQRSDLRPVTATRFEAAADYDAVTQIYKNLGVSHNHIRLLQVRSRGGATNAPLDCRLYVADLSSAPSYTALSYVWDRPSVPKRHILCNDVTLPVTRNCYSALQHLHAANGTFDIWVDAICINQKDEDEKMQQIKLMGDIYSQARTTYIWLGLADATTSRVVAFLGRAGFLESFCEDSIISKEEWRIPCAVSAYMLYMRGRWGWRSSMVPHAPPYYFFGLLLPRIWLRRLKDNECTYDELDKYFDCKWITRIWTYQEVILSRNPVLVRGDTQISWDRLEYSVVFLASLHRWVSSYNRSSDSSELHHWVDTMSARELHRALDTSNNDSGSRILVYWRFCRSINEFRAYSAAIKSTIRKT